MKRIIIMFLSLGLILNSSSCKKDNSLDQDLNQDDDDSTSDQIVTGNFDFDGQTRYYTVFLPENYSGKTSLPLVINLHAYSFTQSRQMEYTRMNLVADTSGFMVVYPGGSNNWNSGISDHPGYPTPDIDDVGFISALIDTLSNKYSNLDPDRVYACGFSNGGIMSQKLACQLSNRIAAIASVAGGMTSSTVNDCVSTRAIPVLLILGTADGTANEDYFYTIDQILDHWKNINNCVDESSVQLPDTVPGDGCTVEKISYFNSSDEVRVLFYKVINGGHSWPGAIESEAWSGNTNMDINANVEIWNFFKNYTLND